MKFEYPQGATPLDPNEADGLKLPLSTQLELNSAEYKSILTCRIAYLGKRISVSEFLTIGEQLKLHREMFFEVWDWAGRFRQSEKSLGVAPHQIQVQLQMLLDNIRFRCENLASDDQMDLLATFHHQLVSIHPFTNGNGRHARLSTDKLARILGLSLPHWGDERYLGTNGDVRRSYIHALQMADRGDRRSLMGLMGSG